MLAALGLSEWEDVVYRYLVSSAPATAEEMRAQTGLRTAHGSVRPRPAGGDEVRLAAGGRTRPVHRRLTRDSRRGYRQEAGRPAPGTGNAGKLAARYGVRYLEADGAGVFEVIRGAGPLRARVHEMVSSARSEAVNMVKPPVIAMQASEHVEPGEAVRGRVIFDRDSLADAQTLDAIRSRPGTHYEVRVHTMVPVKMLATDRAMALVPLAQQGDGVPAGVMITESAVLDSFLALFDYVWETAVGFHVREVGHGTASPLRQADRQLLSLLLAGLTDQAIAAHFKVSVRTVERKVHALMDAAHVRTRMQLAWEASRQQWL